jgi:hypothetical protein
MYQTTPTQDNQDYHNSQPYDCATREQYYGYQNQTTQHEDSQPDSATAEQEAHQRVYPTTPQYKTILQHDQADQPLYATIEAHTIHLRDVLKTHPEVIIFHDTCEKVVHMFVRLVEELIDFFLVLQPPQIYKSAEYLATLNIMKRFIQTIAKHMIRDRSNYELFQQHVSTRLVILDQAIKASYQPENEWNNPHTKGKPSKPKPLTNRYIQDRVIEILCKLELITATVYVSSRRGTQSANEASKVIQNMFMVLITKIAKENYSLDYAIVAMFNSLRRVNNQIARIFRVVPTDSTVFYDGIAKGYYGNQ